MGARIRPCRVTEVEALRSIEAAAGARFAEVGMPEIAADEPMSAGVLARYCRCGRCWVAAGEDDRAVGYAVVDLLDGYAHVEQVSVHPRWQGQGLGRALLDAVEEWAWGQELRGLTLTTFRDVPWNRPLYEHLGFRVLSEAELSPGLRARRTEEAEHGLRPALRVCMYRALSPPRGAPAAADPSASGSPRPPER